MKVEIMNITGKGICLVISEINPNDFVFGADKPIYNGGVFSNVKTIADYLRYGMKIAAIKEVRSQTGWELRAAKEYVDKYTLRGCHYNSTDPAEMFLNDKNADEFINAHTPLPPTELLNEDEFKL